MSAGVRGFPPDLAVQAFIHDRAFRAEFRRVNPLTVFVQKLRFIRGFAFDQDSSLDGFDARAGVLSPLDFFVEAAVQDAGRPAVGVVFQVKTEGEEFQGVILLPGGAGQVPQLQAIRRKQQAFDPDHIRIDRGAVPQNPGGEFL